MCAGRLHTRILTVVLEEVGLWVTLEFPLKMSRHYGAEGSLALYDRRRQNMVTCLQRKEETGKSKEDRW